MKRIILILLAMALLLGLSACGTKSTGGDNVKINFGVLKGPTGIGAAPLMRDFGSTDGSTDYNITLAAAPTDLTALLINGEMDIACLPTNVAATLYNKTNGGVQMLAIVTKGMLFILENGGSIQSMADLKGRTVYVLSQGQGAAPEYVFNYLLTQNGLTPNKDVNIVWEDSDTLSTQLAAGDVDLALLPVPNSTSVILKNPDVRYALDLTAEWDRLNTGSGMYMSCVVVRTEFAKAHPDAVKLFLERYGASLNSMIDAAASKDVGFDAAQLLVDQQIVGSAKVAATALPYAGLCNITGAAKMKDAISGYYQVLFDADPSSIGGAIPGDDFYG